jgi:adenylate kinase family enzyme
MAQHRIYIFGASGSGTTTLGKQIADDYSLVHVDCDDHYWAPSDPPFSVKREPRERVISMSEALGDNGWILTGACHGWGGELIDCTDLIVFVMLPTPLRIERLITRERARFGDRILEGGDMYQIHQAFMEYARGYDNPKFGGRNLATHEQWLNKQTKPICKIANDQSLAESKNRVIESLLALK